MSPILVQALGGRKNSKFTSIAFFTVAALLVLVLLSGALAPKAYAIQPGPIQVVFFGQFQLSLTPGAAPSTFTVAAALTGESPVGVSPGPISLNGRAVIVERAPGPNGFQLGTFSVSGTLSTDAFTGQTSFNFVLVNPGPQQRTALQPGTSFNAVFINPGPIQFSGTAVTVNPGPQQFSGSGFVLVQPGPVQ